MTESDTTGGTSGGGDPEPCYEESWTLTIPEIDDAIAVRIDATNTVYVLGTASAATTDAWIGAYDASGISAWALVIDPSVAGVADVDEVALDLELDPNGDLIALVDRNVEDASVGLFWVSPTVTDVTGAGLLLQDELEHLFHVAEWPAPYRGAQLAVTQTGAVFVSGTYSATFQGVWTGRFDPIAMDLIWSDRDAAASSFPLLHCLVADDDHGVFQCVTHTHMVFVDSRIRRFSLDGDEVDSYDIPGTDPPYWVHEVGLDSTGTLVAAHTTGWSGPSDSRVEWLTTDFDLLTETTFDPIEGSSSFAAIAVDDTGNAMLAGSYRPLTSNVPRLRQFDSTGSLVWSLDLDEDPSPVFASLALTLDDGFVVSGQLEDEGWLRKYEPCE
jgi:hypothetical protein